MTHACCFTGNYGKSDVTIFDFVIKIIVDFCLRFTCSRMSSSEDACACNAYDGMHLDL